MVQCYKKFIAGPPAVKGLKEAYITPLLRKPTLDKSDIKNYRPISNLSVLSKLLERAVCTQLVNLNVNSLMPRHQSPYRRRHSTDTALAFVFSELISALDDGNLALMALLSYWTYQLYSTASTTTFCLANSTSHMASEIRLTAGCHRTCQAGLNLFESTAHHLVQRQCNMESLKGPFWGPSCFCYTPPIGMRSSLTTDFCCTFMLTTRSCIYTVIQIKFNSCGSSQSSALWK